METTPPDVAMQRPAPAAKACSAGTALAMAMALSLALAGCAARGEPNLAFADIAWLSPADAPGHPDSTATFAAFELHNDGRRPIAIEGVQAPRGFAVTQAEWHREDRDRIAEVWRWEAPDRKRLDIAPGASARVLVPLDADRRQALETSRWRACLRLAGDWARPVCSAFHDFHGSMVAPRVD
jgi:hypothetical protein